MGITMTETITGMTCLYNLLQRHHITTIFQGKRAPIFHAPDDMKSVQLVHEQSVVHAADGYSRATGKTGVAFITADAGLTNAITSIGTAQLDSVPLVIFVKHVSNNEEKQLDIEGLTKSIAKHTLSIQTIDKLATTVNQAFFVANSDRPGTVVVSLSYDILEQACSKTDITARDSNKTEKKRHLSPSLVHHIVSTIQQAKKPVLLVGGGTVISGASQALNSFIQTTQIPFVSTLMGLGATDVHHPLHLGMVGMHGTFAANRAIHQADVLICLGVRFSDRITGKVKGFSPHSIKIQIDIDPAEINKKIPVDIPVIGDVTSVLTLLLEQIESLQLADWHKQALSWQRKSSRFHQPKNHLIHPDHIIQALYDQADVNAIVATDVGQHQMWTAHHYPFTQPRQFLTSGGFGTMGYGLPAAIGGACSSANQQVLCVTGDGSIQMNLQELVTAVQYHLNIKIAILKNGYLGMVRQWQQLFYQRNYSQVKITSPDYLTFAVAMGAAGFKASTLKEAEQIISKAFSIEGPVVMEFIIEDERNVYPIVPPGGNNTDALDAEEERKNRSNQ